LVSQTFYCCPCETSKKEREEHAVLLPYKVEGLGEYTRLRSAVGVYLYGEPYKLYKLPDTRASSGEMPVWPARFGCFRCAIQDRCAEPVLGRISEKPIDEFYIERFRAGVVGQSLWRIEIEDDDERYRTLPLVKETILYQS
jgi:hypothetical protein